MDASRSSEGKLDETGTRGKLEAAGPFAFSEERLDTKELINFIINKGIR